MTKNEKARAMVEDVPELAWKFSKVRVSDHKSFCTVSLETDSAVTFEMMDAISSIFKTKKIDFAGESRGPGCSSCGHGGGSYVTIEIYNAVV